LPQIGSRKKYEIDGDHIQSENEAIMNRSENLISEHWLSNDNHKIRDYQIKESFKRVESKLENKSRIDAMFSGTTCVMTFFDHDMIVCANSGDSRAILVSE
jgi:serine/threonine protein phosphatase PrpC